MAASGVLSSWLMFATNCDLCWLAISSSRLFWAISSNSRAFSSAIADWSAKLCIKLTTAGGNSPVWRRCSTSAPGAPSLPSRGTMRAACRPALSAALRSALLGRDDLISLHQRHAQVSTEISEPLHVVHLVLRIAQHIRDLHRSA